ncbi:hypothetical protein LZ31DRAFT_555153 [Colletotrichum somersetense]|nr:hypothetical protein LZ31DRAFT_555153 [Colletotrichum somersetense]
MGNEHRGLGPVCHPPGQYQFQSSPSIPSAPIPPSLPAGLDQADRFQADAECHAKSPRPPSPKRACTLDVRLGHYAARHPYYHTSISLNGPGQPTEPFFHLFTAVPIHPARHHASPPSSEDLSPILPEI